MLNQDTFNSISILSVFTIFYLSRSLLHDPGAWSLDWNKVKSMEPILYMRRMETMLVENWFMYTTCVVHGAIHVACVEQSLCTHPALYKTL